MYICCFSLQFSFFKLLWWHCLCFIECLTFDDLYYIKTHRHNWFFELFIMHETLHLVYVLSYYFILYACYISAITRYVYIYMYFFSLYCSLNRYALPSFRDLLWTFLLCSNYLETSHWHCHSYGVNISLIYNLGCQDLCQFTKEILCLNWFCTCPANWILVFRL